MRISSSPFLVVMVTVGCALPAMFDGPRSHSASAPALTQAPHAAGSSPGQHPDSRQGTIVFSDQPIELDHEAPSALKRTFPAGSRLYGRAYLSPAKPTSAKRGITKIVSVDGRPAYRSDSEIPSEWETVQVWLSEGAFDAAFKRAVADGARHQVSVRIEANGLLLAAGECVYGAAVEGKRAAPTGPASPLERCDRAFQPCASEWGAVDGAACVERWRTCLRGTREFARTCRSPGARKQDFHSHMVTDDTHVLRCDGNYRVVQANGMVISDDDGSLPEGWTQEQHEQALRRADCANCKSKRNQCQKSIMRTANECEDAYLECREEYCR